MCFFMLLHERHIKNTFQSSVGYRLLSYIPPSHSTSTLVLKEHTIVSSFNIALLASILW